MIYQSMGDIGALSAYLDRSGQSKKTLYFSVISLCILYYFLQLACYNIWTRMSFNQTYTDGINDAYFFYVFTMELACFLFVRTRTSIKYFPKFITLANISFLMYVNSYMYAC